MSLLNQIVVDCCGVVHGMRRKFFVLATSSIVLGACATTPAMLHHPNVPENTYVELAGIFSPADEIEETTSPESEDYTDKVKTSNRAGSAYLFQASFVYLKINATPLPGGWIGIGKVDRRQGFFNWYPAIEFSGNSNSDSTSSQDGYLRDSDGNRYLYEIKRESNTFGLVSPQLFMLNFHPMWSVFFAAQPGFISKTTKTSVNFAYETDRRLVMADPETKTQYESLLEEDSSETQFFVPLNLGVRFQHERLAVRLQYVDRSFDSLDDYSVQYRTLYMAGVGWVFGKDRRKYWDRRLRKSKKTPPESRKALDREGEDI